MIVSNDNNLSYGNIISVYTGTDEAITAVTDHGIEELSEMIFDTKRSGSIRNSVYEGQPMWF